MGFNIGGGSAGKIWRQNIEEPWKRNVSGKRDNSLLNPGNIALPDLGHNAGAMQGYIDQRRDYAKGALDYRNQLQGRSQQYEGSLTKDIGKLNDLYKTAGDVNNNPYRDVLTAQAVEGVRATHNSEMDQLRSQLLSSGVDPQSPAFIAAQQRAQRDASKNERVARRDALMHANEMLRSQITQQAGILNQKSNLTAGMMGRNDTLANQMGETYLNSVVADENYEKAKFDAQKQMEFMSEMQKQQLKYQGNMAKYGQPTSEDRAYQMGTSLMNSVGPVAALATTLTGSSSKRFKKKIKVIESNESLEKVLKFKPVHYQWKFDSSDDTGFIAEELNEVIPELVKKGPDGKPVAVHYGQVTAYNSGAIQALNEKIESLESRVRGLEGVPVEKSEVLETEKEG